MTRFSTATATVVAAASLVQLATAHIYLLDPLSRSFANSETYKEKDDPDFDACPHCYNARGAAKVRERGNNLMAPDVLEQYGGGEFPLNFVPTASNGNFLEPNEVAVRHGYCGDPEQFADEGTNKYSTASSDWGLVGSYRSGEVIEFDVVMNAYHWGHLEFFICNTDGDPNGIPTQECFNRYPLTRAAGDDSNSPIDPNFPGRYYSDPTCRAETGEVEQTKPLHATGGENMKMRYVLPDIECAHCILQMVYHTGNTCYHIGYQEFNPPSWPSTCAPNKEKWVDLTGGACGQDGLYPEEFWACADFSITRDGSPTPTTGDTPPPVSTGTPPPVPAPTPYPETEPAGCAEEWGQCGGAGGGAVDGVWTGPTCCADGATCTYQDVYWSDCRASGDGGGDTAPTAGDTTPTAACAGDWGQCGGAGGGAVGGVWGGPTCCEAGASCTYKDEWWSECRPDSYDGRV